MSTTEVSQKAAHKQGVKSISNATKGKGRSKDSKQEPMATAAPCYDTLATS